MTIDQAIRRLRTRVCPYYHPPEREDYEAIELGIEALARQRDFRVVWTKAMLCPLPGETKEYISSAKNEAQSKVS